MILFSTAVRLLSDHIACMFDANMVEKLKISVGGGAEPPRPGVGAQIGVPDDWPLISFDYLFKVWPMRRFIAGI